VTASPVVPCEAPVSVSDVTGSATLAPQQMAPSARQLRGELAVDDADCGQPFEPGVAKLSGGVGRGSVPDVPAAVAAAKP
jgi:hypothetical protein